MSLKQIDEALLDSSSNDEKSGGASNKTDVPAKSKSIQSFFSPCRQRFFSDKVPASRFTPENQNTGMLKVMDKRLERVEEKQESVESTLKVIVGMLK